MDFRRAHQKTCQNDDDKRLPKLSGSFIKSRRLCSIRSWVVAGKIKIIFHDLTNFFGAKLSRERCCPGYRAHLSNHEGRALSEAGLSVKYFLHFFCPGNAEIYFIDRALSTAVPIESEDGSCLQLKLPWDKIEIFPRFFNT